MVRSRAHSPNSKSGSEVSAGIRHRRAVKGGEHTGNGELPEILVGHASQCGSAPKDDVSDAETSCQELGARQAGGALLNWNA